jgi:hypothetical protein
VVPGLGESRHVNVNDDRRGDRLGELESLRLLSDLFDRRPRWRPRGIRSRALRLRNPPEAIDIVVLPERLAVELARSQRRN